MTTTTPPLTTDHTRPLDLPRPTGAAGLVTTTLGVARRTVLRNVRTPQVFFLGMIQGAMFLLIFRYVFGGAIASGIRYVDFLVPGFVATGVLYSGMMSSIGAAQDLEEGFFDRLRSLPVPRVGVVAGRVVADTFLAGTGLCVTVVVGFLVGFRTSAPLGGLLLAVALCLFAAFAFTWMFALLGILSGNPQAAQGVGILVFPLTFVSSAFVPVESMPGWLQAFARNQPLSDLVNAVRAFSVGDHAERVLGHAPGYFAVRTVLWCILFIAVFAPLAARRYQRG